MKSTHKKPHKVIIVLAAMILVVAVTAVSVFAYLKTNTSAVNNDFSVAGEADPTIEESINNPLTVKKDVYVTVPDVGYAVYVRAAIVITWKSSENGDVLGQPPAEGTDYVISLNETAWFKDETSGFYYCKTYVESGKNSPVLITSVNPTGTAPTGYKLNVEIITQTIQAAGMTDVSNEESAIPAVTDAWKIQVDADGKLIKP